MEDRLIFLHTHDNQHSHPGQLQCNSGCHKVLEVSHFRMWFIVKHALQYQFGGKLSYLAHVMISTLAWYKYCTIVDATTTSWKLESLIHCRTWTTIQTQTRSSCVMKCAITSIPAEDSYCMMVGVTSTSWMLEIVINYCCTWTTIPTQKESSHIRHTWQSALSLCKATAQYWMMDAATTSYILETVIYCHIIMKWKTSTEEEQS